MSSFADLLALVGSTPNDVPVFFLGRPGIGKSALAQAIAAAVKAKADKADATFYMDRWELTSHEPTDIGGIPFMRDGYTYFCPPQRLAKFAKGSGPDGSDPYGVIIFEDITQAQRGTQNACLQLVQEGSIGDLVLSPNVRIILTGNRVNDKAGARELPSPLKNRVLLLDLNPNLEEWMYWAAAKKLPAVVGGFLSYKPGLFSMLPNEADKENGQFATPRSWANVGKIYEPMVTLGKGDLGPLYTSAAGLVGTGTATEFVAFVRLQKELPDPKAVLEDPEKALPKPPEEPDRLAAMVTALGEYAAIHQKQDKKIYYKLLIALAHVSQKSREGCAAGVSVFQANGGDVGKLVDAADKNKKDSRILSVLKFFAEATK